MQMLESIVSLMMGNTKDLPPGHIEVMVKDKCKKDAIASAEVRIEKDAKKTKKTGIANFKNLEPRGYVIDVKKEYQEADYFVFLTHYPRSTLARKAVVQSSVSASVDSGKTTKADVEIMKFRVVDTVMFKRLEIGSDPGLLLPRGDEASFKDRKSEFKESIDYGHWWVEINGNESYGWWPRNGVGFIETFVGVEGLLNQGKPKVRGKSRDPHHGEPADFAFNPVIGDCRSDSDIHEIIRGFATSYTGKWSWRGDTFFDNNCHTMQKRIVEAIRAVGFREA